MSLSNLPTEIILEILSFQEGDNRTLFNLCLCSKALYQVTIPFLYHHPDLRFYRCKGWGKLARFTNVLLWNPSLAECVRSIDLGGVGYMPKSYVRDLTIDKSAHPKLMELVRGLRIAEENTLTWLAALQETSWNSDVTTAAILTLIPSIERLAINLSPSDKHTPYLLTAHAGKENGAILPNLSELIIDGGHDIDFRHPLMSMLCIPSLTNLTVKNWIRPWGPSTSPNPSMVRHLELENCAFQAPDLEMVLSRCHSLESFTVNRYMNPWHCHGIPASSLNAHLRVLSGTLRQLNLLFDPECLRSVDQEINPLNLAGFDYLEFLHVATRYLVQDPEANQKDAKYDPEASVMNARMPLHERLPPSLLVLEAATPNTPAMVSRLLGELHQLLLYRGREVRLQEVIVYTNFGEYSDELKFEARGVRGEAQKAGVTLRLMKRVQTADLDGWEEVNEGVVEGVAGGAYQ